MMSVRHACRTGALRWRPSGLTGPEAPQPELLDGPAFDEFDAARRKQQRLGGFPARLWGDGVDSDGQLDERAAGSFGRFLRLARQQAPLVAASVVCVGAYSSATLAIPAGFGELIDAAARGAVSWRASGRLLAWFALAGVSNFARLALVGYAGERVIARLRQRVYKAIMAQSAAFFDSPRNRTGALVQRLSADTNIVGCALTDALSQGAKNVLQTVGSFGVMMYFSPRLTGVIALVLPPVALVAGTYGRFVRRLQAAQQDGLAAMATVAEERLGNVRTVKAFARAADEVALFAARTEEVFRLARRMVLWNATYVGTLHVSGYLTLFSVVWAGSGLVATGKLTPGGLFSFMLYAVYCGIGITGVTNMVAELNKGYGASLRMFEVIDRAQRIAATQGGAAGERIPAEELRGRIAFRDVDFAYPTRPEAPVFRGLTLELPPAGCTVVVGGSGAGKSSLAMLLLKLYRPTAGAVTLDGRDVAALDTPWLRTRVGVVPQEPVLFGGTVAQNIAYGLPDHSWDAPLSPAELAAVTAAAQLANAHGFIEALPGGYSTFVGESGRSLSGGQKQRIAIARALVKRPPLLVLDEATSALDAESEGVVQDAIERIVGEARASAGAGRTVLMFAHRLSMIRMADRVVVLRGGQVAAQGTFEEVSQDAHFRHLVGLDAASPAPVPSASAE